MKHALHPAIRLFVSVPADRAAVFCDFDGTLSDIVAEPSAARAVRGAARALVRLAPRYAVVAVVSGRPVRDLAARMRAPGVRLVGLHGMEELRGGEVVVAPEAERFRPGVSRAVLALRSAVRGMRGLRVEEKGLALAVHFRRSPDPSEMESITRPIVDAVASEEGLEVFPGRLVLELRPPAGGDKGNAIARVLREIDAAGALAVGDDLGDLPMFEAVRAVDCSVVVAVANAERPSVAGAADVIVSSPREVVALLKSL